MSTCANIQPSRETLPDHIPDFSPGAYKSTENQARSRFLLRVSPLATMMHPALWVLGALLGSVVDATSPYDLPASEWNALNATVGGRLGRGVPLSRACFSQVGVNVTDAAPGADCATVQSKYGVASFRSDSFGARMQTQWETCQRTNQGCLLDTDNPKNASAYSPPQVCYQGSVSPYYIAVKTAADVTQSFAFSKRTGVPLVIKNTGHDYQGRSSAPGTLGLWTHNIKYINYSTTFVPEGCSVQGVPALTYGAGQDMESLFLFAEANGITVVGGSSKSVGAGGGWVQGGGHGILSNIYGLGADLALQMRVVTPDGRLRVANACQNQDLFWALRGGGGGTFGVVLEVTSQVIPNKVPTVSLKWDLTPTSDNIKAFMKIVVDNTVRWSQEGWGGYLYPTTSLLANPRLNSTAAAASLKPLTDFFATVTDGAGGGAGSGAQAQWTQNPTFLPLLSSILAGSGEAIAAPRGRALASRLLPGSLFTPGNNTAVLNAILQAISATNGVFGLYMTTPYSYQVPNTQQGKTSVSPAWRGAAYHAIAAANWDWEDGVDVAKKSYITANAAINPLRALTPGGGAYHNEADVYEPNASASFWGSNYAQLYAVKRKYDPDGLLDCWHCVGWKGKTTPIASCYF